MIVQEPVQAAIWHCLNHYAYPDAIFLAERLYAEVDNEEALFLLATCYYRYGKVRQALGLLSKRSLSLPRCKFLLAKCCYDLEKYAEAEAAIIGGYYKQIKNFDEIVSQFGDEACFTLQIIAKVYYKTSKIAKANEANKLALKLNPFLWNSFEELCNTGDNVDPSKIFQLDKLDSFSSCHGNFSSSFFSTPENDYIIANNNTPNTPVSNCNNVTPTQNINGGLLSMRLHPSIEESPQNHFNSCSTISPKGKPPRYRSMFSNSMSPLTPSFGILPLDINTPEPAIIPTHATLTEANDQKNLAIELVV